MPNPDPPVTVTAASEWKRGWPPGKYYKGMTDDFEIYFAPIGGVWHRRISGRADQDLAARHGVELEEKP